METGSEGFEIEEAATGIQQLTQVFVVRYGAESGKPPADSFTTKFTVFQSYSLPYIFGSVYL